MNNDTYSLASSSWDQKEVDAMQRVISSGLFSMGKEVKSFEEQFAGYFGKKYAIMANSGSSANLLMIASLFFRQESPLKKGDEVIVPTVSWSTSYLPLQQYGLKVKFVDIDIHTLNFDLDALESAVTDQTKVILAVNLLGNPNDFGRISKIIDDKDIILLEDNCESMGAEFGDKMAGSIGLMGTFSSFFSHHISTMEGGMVVTDDEELYQIMLSLRAHGWTRNLPVNNLVTGSKSENSFEESYKFVLPGYNLRPLELSGAIGQEQLKKLPEIVKYRRLNAGKFINIVNKYPWLIPQQEIGKSSWFGFSLIVRPDSGVSREMLIQVLENHGIEYRPIVAGNFVKNPVIKYFDYLVHGELTNANLIDSNGLFIGNHHFDLSKELTLLKSALDEVK
ncbi:MAG: pyridoxamine 5-phosphate oxidase [Bacteroidetes bacterium CG_4_9_14_3_um_filter_41_19]|nr:MAG: pyridoxamine 5-phosphate oxidase [Bacteroidetes bacterium CG_4_9_14_3_um_filter_41_19]